MQLFCGISLFWFVLALFYLSLAIVTFVRSRPIKSNLAQLAQEGPDSSLTTVEGKDISLNENLYRAYNSIIVIDIIGFILAAVAAIITILL